MVIVIIMIVWQGGMMVWSLASQQNKKAREMAVLKVK